MKQLGAPAAVPPREALAKRIAEMAASKSDAVRHWASILNELVRDAAPEHSRLEVELSALRARQQEMEQAAQGAIQTWQSVVVPMDAPGVHAMGMSIARLDYSLTPHQEHDEPSSRVAALEQTIQKLRAIVQTDQSDGDCVTAMEDALDALLTPRPSVREEPDK